MMLRAVDYIYTAYKQIPHSIMNIGIFSGPPFMVFP
jgi:hypothetical protein